MYAARALALCALLLLAACGNSVSDSFQGYVEGEYVELASPYAGQLQKLYVRRGDSVRAGQAVFALERESELAARAEAAQRLKSAEARLANLRAARRAPELEAIKAQLAQARAARELSATQLAQQEKLFAGGFISQARLDEARAAHSRDLARVAEAEAQLQTARQPLGRDAELRAAAAEAAAARAALEQTSLRFEQKALVAPRDGLVQDTYYVEGEWVAAGRPVASLLPPGNVKARFYVPETVVGSLAPGRRVEISCDGCPAPVAAVVSYISSQAEYTPPVLYGRESRAKLLYLVEARPEPTDGARLRPGQPVDVRLK
jgi:HlyD family secretion protein